MSLDGKQFEKKQRPIPPQGPQVAVLYSIIDLGRHAVSFQGQPAKEQSLVHFSWELPNLPFAVFKDGEAPKPLALFQEYSTSLGEKAKLPKMLTSFRGVPPVDLAKELPLFIGQPCLINVEYKHDKTKPEIIYANVGMNGLGVMRLPQGTQVNQLTNPKMFFNLDTYSHAEFAKLPTFIQKKIQTSLDWSGIVAKFGAPPVVAATSQPQVQNTGFAQPTQQVQQPIQPIINNPFDNTESPF